MNFELLFQNQTDVFVIVVIVIRQTMYYCNVGLCERAMFVYCIVSNYRRSHLVAMDFGVQPSLIHNMELYAHTCNICQELILLPMWSY